MPNLPKLVNTQPPSISNWADVSGDFEIFEKYRLHYMQPEVLDEIRIQSKQTLNWMLKNEDRYEYDGLLKSGTPWFPKVKSSKNKYLLRTRWNTLHDFVNEHGLMHFLLGLAEKKICKCTPQSNEIKILTEATTSSIINQLVAISESDEPVDNITLTTFCLFYCCAGKKKAANIRTKYLTVMCQLGILTVRYNQSYAISIGPVGEAFFKDVYYEIFESLNDSPLPALTYE